jgi:hypothetical protein
MKAKANKHPRTRRKRAAAKQATLPVGCSPASDWWLPQLDAPVGRVELAIRSCDYVTRPPPNERREP